MLNQSLIECEFPQDEKLIYLNHAAVSPWPQRSSDAVRDFAVENGFQLGIAQQRHSPMVTLQSRDMYALVAKLAEENIITSCRDNNLRISPHFYNNLDDIEHLFQGLNKNQTLLV